MNSTLNPNNLISPADGAARAAGPAMQAMAHGAGELRSSAAPALRELAHEAEDLVGGRLRAAREQARHLRDSGMDYARGHPLQSLLLAMAAGAGLVLALGLLSGRNRSR